MSYTPTPVDIISIANSSATTLGIAGVFTGTSEDITQFKEARVTVFADQVSATNGLSIEQSSNGTNWDNTDTYTVPSNTGKAFSVPLTARFFRIVYTNGGVAQTAFRLQTIFKTSRTKPSNVKPQDARSNENDFEEVLSYPMIYNGASWDRYNPNPTASGNITTQNLVPAGTATANSAVEITLNGAGTLGIQTTGTYTGALSVQVTLNGTTWITLAGVPILNLNTGGNLATITSALQSVFQVDVGGVVAARVTALAAVTGTAAITLKAIQTASLVALDAALPTGANTIGAVTMTSTTLTAVTPGVGAANLGKAEDAVAASGDTGVAMLAVRQDAAATTGANGDYTWVRVDQFGQTPMIPGAASAATLTNVTSSATNVTIVAANTARKSVLIFNESTSILYLKFGATASATSYTVQLASNTYYEMPIPVYTGVIEGLWSSANGSARITELT